MYIRKTHHILTIDADLSVDKINDVTKCYFSEFSYVWIQKLKRNKQVKNKCFFLLWERTEISNHMKMIVATFVEIASWIIAGFDDIYQ